MTESSRLASASSVMLSPKTGTDNRQNSSSLYRVPFAHARLSDFHSWNVCRHIVAPEKSHRSESLAGFASKEPETLACFLLIIFIYFVIIVTETEK